MATLSANDLRTRRGLGSAQSGGSASSWGGGYNESYSPSHSWAGSSPPASGKDHAAGSETLSPQQRQQLNWTFALLLITAVCLHADQNLAAPNLSAIANDFQMTPLQKDTRLGGVVQFGFFLIGGAVSLLIGPAADQVDRVTLLSIVVLCGSVPSFLMSEFVPSTKAGFFYFFLSRVCTGIAIGGSFPVLFSLTADLFPASQRGFVSTCISAATNIGAAVGGMMAGIVGPRYGWRVPFRIVAVPAMLCAVLVRVALEDPRVRRKKQKEDGVVHNPAFTAWTGGEEQGTEGYVRMEELDFTKFRRILDVKTNMLIFCQALPGCIPISCIVTFLSDYLSVEQGMHVQASTVVTAVFGVSCLCFAVGGGLFGQRLYSRRKDQLPLLIGACSCLAAVPFIILVNSPRSMVTSSTGRPTAFALLLALMGGCGALAGPNIRAILMNVNDNEVRGTVFSAFTLFDDLGKGIGPSIIVAATAVLGRRAAYTLAFTAWWISGGILMTLREHLPRDAAKSGASVLPFKKS